MKIFRRTISFIAFTIFSLIVIFYLPCEIYNFQAPQKFSGSFLYNPYKEISQTWQKTNFHAHAIAWHGITNGKQPAQKILNLYKQKGYAYACISNYESIAEQDAETNSLNVYEHGYNIRKAHQLVIMPQKVCYSDFPLWQFLSAKQFTINKLSASAKAVVMAHPDIKQVYSADDLKKLSGYNLMEVLNHSVNSSDKWDIALSAGRPVWIVGDDDSHDMFNTIQTFTNWTMIGCKEHNKDSLVKNLINGNAYGVEGKNAVNDNTLTNVKINVMQVSIQLQNKADSIKLIGQNGAIKQVVFNTDNTNYAFLKNDTYIRAVVYNRQSKMYLNPVMRYDGKSNPRNISTAIVNPVNTILYRSFLLFCWIIFSFLLNRKSILFILKWLSRLIENRRKPSLVLLDDVANNLN